MDLNAYRAEIHEALAAIDAFLDNEDANDLTGRLLAAKTEAELDAVKADVDHYSSFYLR